MFENLSNVNALNNIADSFISCPQIVCSLDGTPVYFNSKIRENILVSEYSNPIYEYMPESARKRFLGFLDSSDDFSDFELANYGKKYSHAFAVKDMDACNNPSLIRMYFFVSRKEMIKSGISSDFMYEIYGSYMTNVLEKLSLRIAESVLEMSSGIPHVPEEFARLVLSFTKLSDMNSSVHKVAARFDINKISVSVSRFLELVVSSVMSASEGSVKADVVYCSCPESNIKIDTSGFPVLISGLISILADLSSDKSVKIEVTSSGDTSMIEIYSGTESIPAIISGGTLFSLSQSYPQFAVRLSMCDIIASRADYEVACSSYMTDVSLRGDDNPVLKFSIIIDPAPVYDRSVKAPLARTGELISDTLGEKLIKAADVFFSGIIR